MRILILSICLILSGWVSGQCKYDIKEVDAFTKKVHIEGKSVRVFWPTFGGTSIYMSVGKVDTSYYLLLQLASLHDTYCISNYDSLFVLSSNGQVYKFNHRTTLKCSDLRDQVFTAYFYFYGPKEYFKELSHGQMMQIRLQTSDGYIDWDMQSGNSSKLKGLNFFSEAVPCVVN